MPRIVADEVVLSLPQLYPVRPGAVHFCTRWSRATAIAATVHSHHIVTCWIIIEDCNMHKLYKVIRSYVHVMLFIRLLWIYNWNNVAKKLTKHVTGSKTLSFGPTISVKGPTAGVSNRVGCCMDVFQVNQQAEKHNRHDQYGLSCTASSPRHFKGKLVTKEGWSWRVGDRQAFLESAKHRG